MSVTPVFRGDTITTVLQLRVRDKIDRNSENPFPLPSSFSIEIRFPGATGSSVVLSTDNPGEIDIIDYNASTIIGVMTPAKSDLLKLSSSNELAAVDCTVTDTSVSPNVVTTFQKLRVYNIMDPINS